MKPPQGPRYPSAAQFRAARYLAEAVRAEFPAAACVHVECLTEGGYAITEVRDGAGSVLNGGGGGPSFDGFPQAGTALSTALDAMGTAAARDERCARCDLAVVLPGERLSALEDWRGRVEMALEVERSGTEAFIWDARSTANDYKPVGAGVLHLPVDTDVSTAAAQLREALDRITRDWSVDVRLASRDHDGEQGSGWIGFSEPWDAQESPDYDLDDEYDGR